VVFELINVPEDSLDQATRGVWIIQRNVIRDRVQIAKRWLGPNYFSHLAIRCLA
jgi:hypothetical protein